QGRRAARPHGQRRLPARTRGRCRHGAPRLVHAGADAEAWRAGAGDGRRDHRPGLTHRQEGRPPEVGRPSLVSRNAADGDPRCLGSRNDESGSSMRRSFVTLCAAAVVALAVVATAAGAGPILASGPSPFSACTADNAAAQQLAGSTLYMNAEPEMRSTINPTNANNIVGAYQQDRCNDPRARPLLAAWSKDGGSTWHPVPLPGDSKCSGGNYDRASDPWVSFAPNGDLYSISLSFDVFDSHN